MFGWPGPDAALTMQSERTGIENKTATCFWLDANAISPARSLDERTYNQ
jgi:hypothetical protein